MGQHRRRTILVSGAAALLATGVLAVLFPETVYDRFVWQYFWGPVVADAQSAATAVHDGVVAHRGYTLVNEIGYGLLLAYALLLLLAVLDRFDIGTERWFALPFIPFIIGGGLLRVVEDAGIAATGVLQYFLISPFIYLTMFLIVLATVVLSILLAQRGVLDAWWHGVAGTGTVFAAGVLAALSLSVPVSHGWILPATIGLAAGVFVPVYAGAAFLSGTYPGLSRLAQPYGVALLGGHLLDAAATALSLDLLGYGEKHPIVRFFVDAAGTPYAFLLLKAVVIGGIVYAMDDQMRSEDPVFFNLAVLGILAVGLGPGTRNLFRAVFGV